MKYKKMIIIIFILIVAILSVVGYLIYDNYLSNNDELENKIKIEEEITKENNNVDTSTDERKNLTADEIEKLQTYINIPENNAFVLIDFSNPEEILTKNNVEILKYSINSSEFSHVADENQKNVIWNGSEAQVSTRVSTIDDINTYLDEKTGYKFSTDKISNAFERYFNEELNLYYYLISDTIFREYKIIDGYETGYRVNKEIHITLDDNKEVVLLQDNNKYYFYSCKKS